MIMAMGNERDVFWRLLCPEMEGMAIFLPSDEHTTRWSIQRLMQIVGYQDLYAEVVTGIAPGVTAQYILAHRAGGVHVLRTSAGIA